VVLTSGATTAEHETSRLAVRWCLARLAAFYRAALGCRQGNTPANLPRSL
jgi:hypothetical protein